MASQRGRKCLSEKESLSEKGGGFFPRFPPPFPKLLFRSLEGGAAPQAEEDGQSSGEHGKAANLVQECKSARSLTGRFTSMRAGDRQAVLFCPVAA